LKQSNEILENSNIFDKVFFDFGVPFFQRYCHAKKSRFPLQSFIFPVFDSAQTDKIKGFPLQSLTRKKISAQSAKSARENNENHQHTVT
jgi:hypothetical protein